MATMVNACSDWLFSCNLAGCPRHIQAVFNLIVDIHVMVSCQKGYPLTSDFFHVSVC